MNLMRSPSAPTAVDAVVAETFVSFQGEGPLTGQRCAFVRFSRCNLRCSWCDTPYTWDWTRFDPSLVASRVATDELTRWVVDTGVGLVVLTGGEPMLQLPAMVALVARLPGTVRVQVETNGTRIPLPALVERVDLWVVSPKLANSGMRVEQRVVPAALRALTATRRAAFKFVVTDPVTDIPEIAGLVDEHGLAPVWVMPEGSTREDVLAGIAALQEPATARGWNVSTRLHVLTGAR